MHSEIPADDSQPCNSPAPFDSQDYQPFEPSQGDTQVSFDQDLCECSMCTGDDLGGDPELELDGEGFESEGVESENLSEGDLAEEGGESECGEDDEVMGDDSIPGFCTLEQDGSIKTHGYVRPETILIMEQIRAKLEQGDKAKAAEQDIVAKNPQTPLRKMPHPSDLEAVNLSPSAPSQSSKATPDEKAKKPKKSKKNKNKRGKGKGRKSGKKKHG